MCWNYEEKKAHNRSLVVITKKTFISLPGLPAYFLLYLILLNRPLVLVTASWLSTLEQRRERVRVQRMGKPAWAGEIEGWETPS